MHVCGLMLLDPATIPDGYDFKEIKGLSVLFQVNNLTDEPTKSYFGEEANTGTIQFFGRQYFVGANYTF